VSISAPARADYALRVSAVTGVMTGTLTDVPFTVVAGAPVGLAAATDPATTDGVKAVKEVKFAPVTIGARDAGSSSLSLTPGDTITASIKVGPLSSTPIAAAFGTGEGTGGSSTSNDTTIPTGTNSTADANSTTSSDSSTTRKSTRGGMAQMTQGMMTRSGGAPVLMGSTTRVADETGQVIFDDLAWPTPSVGAHRLVFAVASASVPLSLVEVPFAVTVGDPHSIVVARGPPEIHDNGDTLARAPLALIGDALGNLVANVSMTLIAIVEPTTSVSFLVGTAVTSDTGTFTFDKLQFRATRNASLTVRFATQGGAFQLASSRVAFSIAPCGEREMPIPPANVACQCAAGSTGESSVGTGCTPCPKGQYSGIAGATSCTACPTRMTTLQEGATSRTACVCDAGYVTALDAGDGASSDDGDDDDLLCDRCPEGGLCPGGGLLEPLPGYWRRSKTSRVIFKCNDQNACLGGTESECDAATEGPLCSVCRDGYAKLGVSCVQCPGSSTAVWAIFVLGCLLVLGVVVFLVATANRDKSNNSLNLKIFMNYLHLLALAKDFELNWPTSFSAVSSGAATASLFSVDIVPFQCVLGLDYYQRLLFFLLLPAAAVAAPLLWYTCVFAVVSIKKAICGGGGKTQKSATTTTTSSSSSSSWEMGQIESGRARRDPVSTATVDVVVSDSGEITVRRPAFLTDVVSQRRGLRVGIFIAFFFVLFCFLFFVS
jgi:hypothetical protein